MPSSDDASKDKLQKSVHGRLASWREPGPAPQRTRICEVFRLLPLGQAWLFSKNAQTDAVLIQRRALATRNLQFAATGG
jgi:hypothetical protein